MEQWGRERELGLTLCTETPMHQGKCRAQWVLGHSFIWPSARNIMYFKYIEKISCSTKSCISYVKFILILSLLSSNWSVTRREHGKHWKRGINQNNELYGVITATLHFQWGRQTYLQTLETKPSGVREWTPCMVWNNKERKMILALGARGSMSGPH